MDEPSQRDSNATTAVPNDEKNGNFLPPSPPTILKDEQLRDPEAGIPSNSSTPEEKPPPAPPPDGGYGWVCVACVFLINAHTWGINAAYGIFLAHYLTTTPPPYTPSSASTPLSFAFIGGLSISTALLVSPLSTYLTRIYGTRFVLLLGVFFEVLALLSASFAREVWQLFLSQGVCFGIGMGFLFVGSVGVVPQWFSTRRSLANGVATAGSGVGGLVWCLAAERMIETVGVGWAFRILGGVAAGVNVVCALVIRDRNGVVGARLRAFDYRLLGRGRGEVWLLLGWGFLSLMGYIVLLFSLPSYAESVGLSGRQGSVVGAVLSLGQGVGRPVVGIFSDRAGRMNMAGLCTFVCGLLCFVIWVFAKSYGVVIFFAVVVGTVAGTIWTVVAPVGAEVVGLRELPSALSIFWLVLVLPATFSEPIALQLRQATGNIYLHAQIYTGCMYVGAALCMWLLRAWKVGELEAMAVREEEEKERDALSNTSVRDSKSTDVQSAAVLPTGSRGRSSLVKRLFAWKKV